MADRKITVGDYIREVIASNEFASRLSRLAQISVAANDSSRDRERRYRVPEFLSKNRDAPKNVLMIGSCLLEPWADHISFQYPGTHIRKIDFNNASKLPSLSSFELATYDFQIVQIPLRSILKEADYFQIKADDFNGHEDLFTKAVATQQHNLEAALRYNAEHGITSFVLGFSVPQQSPIGRLQPRFS